MAMGQVKSSENISDKKYFRCFLRIFKFLLLIYFVSTIFVLRNLEEELVARRKFEMVIFWFLFGKKPLKFN